MENPLLGAREIGLIPRTASLPYPLTYYRQATQIAFPPTWLSMLVWSHIRLWWSRTEMTLLPPTLCVLVLVGPTWIKLGLLVSSVSAP